MPSGTGARQALPIDTHRRRQERRDYRHHKEITMIQRARLRSYRPADTATSPSHCQSATSTLSRGTYMWRIGLNWRCQEARMMQELHVKGLVDSNVGWLGCKRGFRGRKGVSDGCWELVGGPCPRSHVDASLFTFQPSLLSSTTNPTAQNFHNTHNLHNSNKV